MSDPPKGAIPASEGTEAGHSHSGSHARSPSRDHPHAHNHEAGHSHEHDHPSGHGHGHSHEHDHPSGHGHGHSHEHDHPSGHGHGHGHGHAEARGYSPRAPLARGAGKGKVLFLDAFSGVAGDMTIAALVDLGVPFEVISDGLAKLPLEGYELVLEHATRSSIVATRFDVRVAGSQPMRTYATIDAMIAEAALPEGAKALARSIFLRLGEAEAAMHRQPLEHVHFHEVGAVDAIVDICGAALAFEHLGAEVVASPLPMGRGFVTAEHGILPLPAPATVQCLAGVPTYGVDLDSELVTPTGAAIVATVAKRFTRWPSIAPLGVGFGAGTRTLPDRPNLLRVVLGDPTDGREEATHVLIEANVDDMTGELTGHAIAMLLEAGAVDAWATPATGKKGRPCLVISAIAAAEGRDAVAAAMLRETTSIGVRFRPVSRRERPRRTVEVETPFGTVLVKVSEGPLGGPAQEKPEFDRCAELARAHGVPVREVILAALRALGR